jgi:hypothetical protein
MNKGQFKIQKLLDVGTSNPIVSRLSMGLHDIVRMAQIDETAKNAINDANFLAMQNIVKAEQFGLKICQSIEAVMERIGREGVKTQASERCVDLPSTEGLDDIREFLKYGKKAFQEIMKVFNVFLKTSYSNPRYDKICSETLRQYGADDPLTKLVKEDHDLWIKKFLELRDQDEHPTVARLYLDFDINWDAVSQKWAVSVPRFYEGTPIHDFVKTSVHNLLTFAEEATILLLQRTLPPMVEIYEVPQAERDKDCEIRFRLGLKESFRKQNSSTASGEKS